MVLKSVFIIAIVAVAMIGVPAVVIVGIRKRPMV
jgi:hypothetical protein